MRRSLLAMAVLAGVGVIACEDGPKQTYSPPPAGADQKWNNGQDPGATPPAGSSDNATQDFTNLGGGTNKAQICDGATKAARWAKMVTMPITPSGAGGIDMAGTQAGGSAFATPLEPSSGASPETWKGLTIDEADQLLCQSDSLGDFFGDGSLDDSWGDGDIMVAEYSVTTRKIDSISLFPGYQGVMTMTSPDGTATYQVGINQQISKTVNGQTTKMTLDWSLSDSGRATFQEIYNAFIATYAPKGFPQDPPGSTCLDTGHCIVGYFGDVAYFFVPAMGWGLWVDSISAAAPVPSIPTRIDLYLSKIMPFSFANPNLTLNEAGPTASSSGLPNCSLKLGLKFSEFRDKCVEVDGDPNRNAVELAKLVGALSHDDQSYFFNIQGVDLSYVGATLAPTKVVQDNQLPADDDISRSFDVDQSTLGVILNDYNLSTGAYDMHGTGAIYREYARLVKTKLRELAGIDPSTVDESQCLFPDPLPPGFDPNAFMANLPSYCTGFEGMVTPAAPNDGNDRTNVGVDQYLSLDQQLNVGLSLGMKLGHGKVLFCMDPISPTDEQNNVPGFSTCGFQPYGSSGDIFSTSYQRALQIFAHGEAANLPVDVRDNRFFFKMYSLALIKYLMAPDQSGVDISSVPVEFNDIFFDSIGSGQFETVEYVDRRYAQQNGGPTDFEFDADVKNGILDIYQFSRALYRGENAIYTAVRENPSDTLGQESNALISNIFGSHVLATQPFWTDTGTHTAYECATQLGLTAADNPSDAHPCAVPPPLNPDGSLLLNNDGQPLLAPYQPLLTTGKGPSVFALGQSALQVMKTYPYMQQAMVFVPLRQDPWDPASPPPPDAPMGGLQALVPWAPQQPGIGFPIALNGVSDKFIQTSNVDFSGTTISANVDFQYWSDPASNQQYMNILAVETTDFLGDVFLCQDPNTGDLLSARMYTPVQSILDWLTNHPGAYDSCGMIIRWSPFNNYVDYITSLTNGVRLSVTQGGGAGRVVDVILFVPGQ